MAEIIQGRFDDFDELVAVARGWSLELSKLDREPFDGELFQWIEEGFILSRGRFQGHLRQEGSPPYGLRTMTVHISRDMSQYWRGRQVSGRDLLIFPRNSEVDTVSDPKFDIFTISFDEDAFKAQAEMMGCPAVRPLLDGTEVLRCDPRGMDRLRRRLFQVANSAGTIAAAPGEVKRRIQAEVIRLLAAAPEDGGRRHRSERRLRIIQDAQAHLARHPGEAVAVRDLSCAVGVSIRTLQYAFREHLGISPKTYVNALRLNAVRRRLRNSGPGGSGVADVANQLGFWHMGQFAADYRRLFGENPSQTLNRVV